MKIQPEIYERLKYVILNKLHVRELWENVYTPIERVLKAVKGHDRGCAKDVVEDLRKEGFLLYHKNNTCISLARPKKAEIEEFIATRRKTMQK